RSVALVGGLNQHTNLPFCEPEAPASAPGADAVPVSHGHHRACIRPLVVNETDTANGRNPPMTPAEFCEAADELFVCHDTLCAKNTRAATRTSKPPTAHKAGPPRLSKASMPSCNKSVSGFA